MNLTKHERLLLEVAIGNRQKELIELKNQQGIDTISKEALEDCIKDYQKLCEKVGIKVSE